MPHPDILAGMPGWAEDVDSIVQSGAYTPLLTASTTDPSLGVFGASSGTWVVLAHQLMFLQVDILFGQGSSSGSGGYRVGLPDGWVIQGQLLNTVTPLGSVRLRDDSQTSEVVWEASTVTGNANVIGVRNPASFNAIQVQHNSPWTWANGDRIRTQTMTIPVVPDS